MTATKTELPAPPPMYSLAALVDAATADAQARYDAKKAGKLLGAVTPISKLTDALGSYLAPGIHILHGSPGSGKTAFALQTACECGCPAMFITCEMAPLELLRRITARVTDTFLGKFKTGELPPEKARELYQAAATASPSLDILDATTLPLTPADLAERAQTIRATHRDADHDHFMIVIDSVHSWAKGWQVETDERETLNYALAEIRKIASKVEAPILCIAERNRASKDTGGQAASAGTRMFEYVSESVIELHRPANSKADNYGDIAVHAEVSKNRHGAITGKIDMLFNGRTQTFREA